MTFSKALVAHLLRAFVAAVNSSFSLDEKTAAFRPCALPDAEAFFLNHLGRSEKDRGRKVIGREVRFNRSCPPYTARFWYDVEVPSDRSLCRESYLRRPLRP